MKYKHEIIINLPRQKVLDIFDNQENLSKWQKGLVSFTHVSGDAGEVGAVSELKYKMGKRKIDMIETIIKKDLPKEFHFQFEAKGVWNEVKNFFEENDSSSTKWISDNEFKGKGMIAIMMFLMPRAFKKQSFKYMEDFKVFAESEAIN